MQPITEDEEDEAFKNLPPHLAEQLAKAEAKFNPAPKEQNRFSEHPELAREYIVGTHFTAYRNAPAADAPEEYADTPVLLYSEKNRFANLCDLVMKSWLPEFTEFLETLVALEKDSQTGGGDKDLEHRGLEFGLQVNPDTYVVGYTGPASAIFARKELILRLILFVARCAEQASDRNAESPRELVGQVRELLNKNTSEAK